ncbi:MAG: ISNCY family transposase [archaeon]
MKITTKQVRQVATMLDEIIKEYKTENPKQKRDWRTYEQQSAERLKTAFRELKPIIDEAVSMIALTKGIKRGNKSSLDLRQKVLVILLARLLQKSNRNMSSMMILFSWLADVSVGYKTVERLYSDESVALALHNVQVILLRRKGIEHVDGSGDGTGHTITINMHYATEAQKRKDKIKENSSETKKKVIYSFALMDIKTRMYVGYGTSFISENAAYLDAVMMTRELNISLDSIRLDRYYSTQSRAEFLQENFPGIAMYLIPKINATIKGSWSWKRMLHTLVQDPKSYLKEYFHRNQSESGFAEDKKRTGWKLGQKRPERIATAGFCNLLWHNLHWLND